MKRAIVPRCFDLQFFGEERTEPATPRKRNKERQKGRAPKSQDLTASVLLITGLLAMYLVSYLVWDNLLLMFAHAAKHLSSELMFDRTWWAAPLTEGFRTFIATWLPISAICVVAAVWILVRQVGFTISAEALQLNFNKLNPVSGLKKIISMRSLVELVKGLTKAAILSIMLIRMLRNEQDLFLTIIMFPVDQGISIMMGKIWGLAFRMALILFLISMFDWPYQKWEYEKSIRMSKQEIKEEHKQMEGDPKIKGKIRQKQRELARSRMMSSVPKADVVVTNPTEVSIAIQYDQKTMIAPVVVAKGEGFVAKKIRELAKEHKIPIVENKPLARALLAQVEVGEGIPEDLYRAVAEVLAFVYRLKSKKAPGR